LNKIKIMKKRTALHKVLILALSLCAFSEIANAQWTPVKSLGTGPTDGCFSFSLNGKGYAGGGSGVRKFYEYDSLANTWTLKGNAPGNKTRAFGSAFVVNGHGYAVGGDSTGANNPTADMWMYNDTTNTWTQKAAFPGGGRDAMFSFVLNGIAYVGGGFDAGGSGHDDMYKYNAATDTWTALAALSMGVVGFPVSFVINNKAYMGTGQVGASESTGLWEYDPAGGVWLPKASFPGVARQAAFGFAIGGYGYIGGGMSAYDTEYVDMYRYNPNTDSWVAAPGLPSAYPAWASAFTIGTTAFVGTGTYFDNVHSALVSTDSFKKFYGARNPALDIAQVQPNRHFQMIPNPAYDYVTINGDFGQGATVSISDMTGRVVNSFTDLQDKLYIGDMAPGVYVVKCVTSDGVSAGKMIKE
jgi:hypothetical protein